MTRIVAGSAKGRRLAVPAVGTRPTSDRAREALFSALQSRLGSLEGITVADIYAGSGALGLEAVSRGASRVDFVESDRRAVQVLRENIDAVGLPGTHVHAMTVDRWLRAARWAEPVNLLLMDPPYVMSHFEVATVLSRLADAGALALGAVVVIERPHRAGSFDWPPSFEGDHSRRYGEAALWFGRFGNVTTC